MSEPLIHCACEVCGKSFDYGGPEQKGYCKHLCGPFCDGVLSERRRQAPLFESIREADSLLEQFDVTQARLILTEAIAKATT